MGGALSRMRGRVRPGATRAAALAVLALGLAGCFRPLYGPTASGEPLGLLLAGIEVAPVEAVQGQERLGHFLRSELIFDLDGSGQPSPRRYRLLLSANERVQTAIVSSITGRAESATLVGSVSYKLQTPDGAPVTDGVAQASATYDRSVDRYASVRAARDAEIRVAKQLSEQIKIRLASILSAQR
jgi:LPS-assembly lipoprotein